MDEISNFVYKIGGEWYSIEFKTGGVESFVNILKGLILTDYYNINYNETVRFKVLLNNFVNVYKINNLSNFDKTLYNCNLFVSCCFTKNVGDGSVDTTGVIDF